MKQDLCVTLANDRFINQAKQLFSSLYFNAKWKGDCMLLSCNVSRKKLRWFINKGIYVKKCQPLFRKSLYGYSPVVTCKFHLFDVEMKEWKSIIYLDSDVIVLRSLNFLRNHSGFLAVPDPNNGKVSDQFSKNSLFSKNFIKFLLLKNKHDLQRTAFNSGIFAFSTSIINKNTFEDLQKLMRFYVDICRYPDQAILNIYFGRKCRFINYKYNVFPKWHVDNIGHLDKSKVSILHFADTGKKNKPWDERNRFYKEWKSNLDKSNEISF